MSLNTVNYLFLEPFLLIVLNERDRGDREWYQMAWVQSLKKSLKFAKAVFGQFGVKM